MRRDDRGVAVAAAPLIGITILLTVMVVQVSLWFFGRMVVTDAAQHSLDAARVVHETDAEAIADGERIGDAFLEQMGGLDDGTDPTVDVQIVPAAGDRVIVNVVVQAEATEVLPGFPMPSLRVERSASQEQVVD